MMANIINTVILVGSLVTAVGLIIATTKKLLNKATTPVTNQIDNMDEMQCKLFLVEFLNDIEDGVEKDEVQYALAHEVYDHYTNDLGKNSYIHDKWQRVMMKNQ